jgi:hypothetical protein
MGWDGKRAVCGSTRGKRHLCIMHVFCIVCRGINGAEIEYRPSRTSIARVQDPESFSVPGTMISAKIQWSGRSTEAQDEGDAAMEEAEECQS